MACDIRRRMPPKLRYYTHSRSVVAELGVCALFSRVVAWLAVFAYIGVYNIWISEGYRDFADDGQSVVFPELKGSLLTNFNRKQLDLVPENHFGLYNRSWDAIDNIYAYGPDSFFVATNVIITPNQIRGACADYPSKFTTCNPNKTTDCLRNQHLLDTAEHPPSGVFTGRCVPFSDPNLHTCEYIGWCPPQSQDLPSSSIAVFNDSRHFTVTIHNSVYFPKLNLFITNNQTKSVGFWKPENELTQHSRSFVIENLVDNADKHKNTRNTTFDDVAKKGAVIRVEIEWECFVWFWFLVSPSDEWVRTNCLHTTKSFVLEREWFRTNAHYHKIEENTWQRMLHKTYGLNFKVEVTYKVSRFSLIKVILLLVAGGSILGACELFFWIIFSGCWCCDHSGTCGYNSSSTVRVLNSKKYKDLQADKVCVVCTEIRRDPAPREMCNRCYPTDEAEAEVKTFANHEIYILTFISGL